MMLVCILFWIFVPSCCLSASNLTGNSSETGNHSITPLLLISFDGFRADYLKQYKFPNLQKFFSDGVLVEQIKNIFITKTFPNHYSIVTGLYAESHGVLANNMYDPTVNKTVSLPSSFDPFWWNDATPIWVSLQQKGFKTAAAMWPGTDVKIHNMTSTYHMHYNKLMTFQERVDNVTKLLSDGTVKFAALYYEEPDHSGHTYGPDNTTEMAKVLKQVDDNIGYLIEKLNETNLWSTINTIITSDHGMTQCSKQRIIQLEKCINSSSYTLVDSGPVAAILPLLNISLVYSKLKNCHPNMKAYLRNDLPDRLHYKASPRVQPIILIADEGWLIVQSGGSNLLGDHGYDNDLPSMHPFLAAHGPSFRKGYKHNTMNIVDIYPLMCHLLEMQELPNNGSFSHVKCLLSSQWCVSLPEMLGIVIGALMLLTALTCLIVLTKKRAAPSQRPFARLELQEDDDDDPLID
ncbi:bis(5'-adenosyl)-triphosphatase enpp4 [Polypterus senegalus]